MDETEYRPAATRLGSQAPGLSGSVVVDEFIRLLRAR